MAKSTATPPVEEQAATPREDSREDSTASAIEAMAKEKGADVVGGSLISAGVNWGMYTQDGFVPSAEALAVKAVLDAEKAKTLAE